MYSQFFLGAVGRFSRHRMLAAAALVLNGLNGAHADDVSNKISLSRDVVPAVGEQTSILNIPRFGRYSIGVKSAQGVALQLVDHMSGPGATAGVRGSEDGRIDTFLDQGQYKVIARAADNGSGDATLAVRAFAEQSRPVSSLVELRDEQASLGDYEQRSYWLHIEQRRAVALEAAGRHLADLRLWKDGDWLVDVAPQCQVIEPRAGQALQNCQLVAELDPGFYLLSAYGGVGQPWAEQSNERPLHVRYGIPTLGEAGRQRFVASAFGVDRYLVPQRATYFRVELPSAEPARLTVVDYDLARPFNDDGETAQIDKKSSPPVAELTRSHSGSDYHLVSVARTPGESYVLQQFERRTYYELDKDGKYWLSTIHSGHAADSIDATALLARDDNERLDLYKALAIEIDARTGWRRRFNLLDTTTLFIHIATTGEYRVSTQGDARARVRIEPFLVTRPHDYKTPPLVALPHAWTLDPGYYVVTAEPELKGIIDLQIAAGTSPVALDATPLRAAAGFGEIQVDRQRTYTVFLNNQPGVTAGVVLRPLPVDLATPLPVTQMPNEQIEIPVVLSEPGVLTAVAEDGSLTDISLGSRKWQQQAQLAAGTYRVELRPPAQTRATSLMFTPARLRARPMPPAPAALAQLPRLPLLTADTPRFLDLARGSDASFNVQVAEPGLYRLESTGLLQTAGNVRTRTTTALARDEAGGIGRNFLLQQYLRAGDYQVTVAAMNASSGRIGMQLARTALIDGGALELGLPNRALLPTGQALAYRFEIVRAGDYRLQVLGLGRNYNMRVEDEGGWPIAAPNIAGDLTQRLHPGRYRLIVLPQATDVRAVTLLTAVPSPPVFSGHGPHALPIATAVEHTWLEPAAGAERVPDVWRFSLPAAADVMLELGTGMQGELFKDSDSTKTADIVGDRAWRGALTKGEYRLHVVSARPNNRAQYHIKVSTEQLLAGHARDIAAPATLAVAIGDAGLVELSSFGSDDVRARLFDAEHRVVAANDDRPADWNFHIAQRLPAGVYRLQIDPVGRDTAQTTVSVAMPGERHETTLTPPATVSVNDTAIHVYPLAFAPGHNIFVVNAQSASTVAVAVESESDGNWRVVETRSGTAVRMEVPVAKRPQRVRVWSADGRAAAIRVKIDAAAIAPVSEKQWTRGVRAAALAGGGIVAVDVQTPGVFRLNGRADKMRLTSEDGAALLAAKDDIVQIDGKRVWLASDTAGETLRAQRVYLGDELPTLPLNATQPVKIDLARGGDAVLVWAQSRHGQPGVRIDDASANNVAANDMNTSARLGVAEHLAVTVARTPRQAAITVWNADDVTRPLETTLHYARFAAAPRQTLGWGITTGVLTIGEPRQAQIFSLPAGAKRLRLALPPQTAAMLLRAERTLSAHWSGADGNVETLDTDADGLWLLPVATASAPFLIEVMASTVGAGIVGVRPGGLLRQAFAAAGSFRVPVTAVTAPTQLHVLGAQSVTFTGNDGRIVRGQDVRVGVDGVLSIEHGPQTVIVWMEQGADQASTVTASPVRAPTTVALTGTQQDLAVETGDASLVTIETDAPLIARGRDAGGAEWLQSYPQAARFHLYAPVGSAQVRLFPLAESLSGHARITATPIQTLGEGIAAESLILPGAAQAFRFDVKGEGTIGVGVKASADVLSATVLSGDGRRKLGEGVVQMHALTPGAYILLVRAPADIAPVRVRPVLLGLNPQTKGPSADLIRRFVEARADEGLIAVPEPPATPNDTQPPGATTAEPAAEEASETESE